MTAGGGGASDSESSCNLARVPTIVGMIVCLVLLLLVQRQLLFYTTPYPGGWGIGGALWQLVSRGRQPAEPDVWHQVSAPIAKTMMGGLSADLRQRAEPVIDWLASNDGIQRAEMARIMLAGGDLTVDLYGVDEVGCRRIMTAARMPAPPVDFIAVTGAGADMIAVPTTPADEKQCDRKTAYLRLVSHSHPAHDQH